MTSERVSGVSLFVMWVCFVLTSAHLVSKPTIYHGNLVISAPYTSVNNCLFYPNKNAAGILIEKGVSHVLINGVYIEGIATGVEVAP